MTYGSVVHLHNEQMVGILLPTAHHSPLTTKSFQPNL